MAAFARVIVGQDGSDGARHALAWASERVLDPSALHVIEASDSPAETLMDTASGLGADAIVIGNHGSGLAVGLGSVARQLLKDAEIPVIVIDGIEPPREMAEPPPVVACVGYDEPAEAASTWAADFAEEQGLPLVLLHSVAYRPMFPIDSPIDVPASYLGRDVSVEWAKEELGQLAAKIGATHPDLQISTHVEYSSVIDAVRSAGEHAELVVLGKRSEEEFLSTIGTPRLRRLVSRTRFPTAVVPTAVLPTTTSQR